MALPLLAYDRFGSPWAIAAVLLPDLLPAIVFAPSGGRADRLAHLRGDRRMLRWAFSAIDDLGLTAGPALAAAVLAVISPRP